MCSLTVADRHKRKAIPVRLPEELEQRVRWYAEDDGESVNDVMNRAVEAWIAARDQDAALAGWRAEREQEITR